MGTSKTTIKPIPDGPYIVKELTQFSNRKGEIDCRPAMGLCRCGLSANKPFCDGTHKTAGFTSENQLDSARDKLDSYQGIKITIHDNRSICAHAGYCTDGLPSVFRHRQDPFVDADAASVEEIIEIIDKCPSGALTYSVEDAPEVIEIGDSSIFVAPNGPYVVKGDIELVDTQRNKGASESSLTLCRCGASKNKPFCDGSHWEIEFTDDDN